MNQKHPLELEEYRAAIDLTTPFPWFENDDALFLHKSNQITRIQKLITYLNSERGNSTDTSETNPKEIRVEDLRKQLYCFLISRPPEPLPKWFHRSMDALLQFEVRRRGIISADALPRILHDFPQGHYSCADRCILWQGDITTLRIDAIVNAANSELLGCFTPFHACIDNAIHAGVGPRLRKDCWMIMQRQGFPEPTGYAKITRAYNLPSKFVLHTVGPIISHPKALTSVQKQELAACYRSCLDLAAQISEIHSIAFCNISTGAFGFPKHIAAQIALRTVEQWLVLHPKRFDFIVFNVFNESDRAIYAQYLSN